MRVSTKGVVDLPEVLIGNYRIAPARLLEVVDGEHPTPTKFKFDCITLVPDKDVELGSRFILATATQTPVSLGVDVNASSVRSAFGLA